MVFQGYQHTYKGNCPLNRTPVGYNLGAKYPRVRPSEALVPAEVHAEAGASSVTLTVILGVHFAPNLAWPLLDFTL